MTAKTEPKHYYFFDDQVVKSFEKEIRSGKSEKFNNFLIELLKEAPVHPFVRHAPKLCYKVIPLLCRGRDTGLLSQESVDKALHLFRKHQVFRNATLAENLSVVCKDRIKVCVNHSLFVLASNFFKEQYAAMIQNKRKAIEVLDIPASIIRALRDYIYNRTIPLITSLNELESMYDQFCALKDPFLAEFAERMVLKRAENLHKREDFEKFFTLFHANFVSNDALFKKLCDRALESYLEAKSIAFYQASEKSNHGFLHVAQLGLMNKPGVLGSIVCERIKGVIIKGDEDLEEISLLKYMEDDLKELIEKIYFVIPNPSASLLATLSAQLPHVTEMIVPSEEEEGALGFSVEEMQKYFPKLVDIRYTDNNPAAEKPLVTPTEPQ